MVRALPWLALLGCAPPPAVELPADTGQTGPTGPAITILYPKDGDTFDLVGCALVDVPIVVLVEGLELAVPGVGGEGTGHWHGGPDLEVGYCVSSVPYCEGMADTPDGARYEALFDGAGTRKLNVELVDGEHQPVGAEDSVEVTLLDPDGGCP
jgi:hypothetical protein